MKERLVELVKKAHNEQKYLTSDKSINAIADYLLENGVIVPPCKVGGVVYSVCDCINRPEKLFITALHQYEKYISFSALSRSQRKYVFETTDIGKTVFLTKEEAEAKLKEGGKGCLKE